MLSMLKDYTILYVEDEPEIQANISEYLESYFKHVYIASDGKEGLKLYKQYQPNIAIFDVNIPFISGLSLAKQIRAVDKNIKIIMLTGHTETEVLLEATELKLTKYLTKPVSPKLFKEALTQLAKELKENSSKEIQLSATSSWNSQSKVLKVHHEVVTLLEKEQRLLELFIEKRNSTISYEDIMVAVWEDSFEREISIDSKTLSDASDKYSKAEWDALENEIQRLEKKEQFNTILENSIKKNIATLNSVGLDKEEAYSVNSDVMFEDLTNLNISDLDTQIVEECKEDEVCKEEAYDSLSKNFELDKEEAYGTAIPIKGFVNDKLVKEFKCEEGEVKTVQHYGVEDGFSTANGAEPSNPAPHIASVPWIANYPFPITGYDEVSANRIFAETITNLPTNITKGAFLIGFKNNGTSLQGNDTMAFGNYANNDVKSIALNSLNWSTTAVGGTTIFQNSFNNIDVNSSNLLTMVQNSQQFDVVVQDDTSVDFITVATCSKPDPIKDITNIVNKFECSEKETLVKILGGEIDAFAGGTDATNPSSSLLASSTYTNGQSDYDQTNVNKELLDTLDLSQISGIITKAEFHVGYKSLGDPLTGNDTIHIGEYGVEHIGGRYLLYPNGTNPLTPMPWVPNAVTINANEVEQLLSVDLNKTTSTNSNLNMLDWIQGKSAFDVRVEDDTAVDFTQLNLCVKEACAKEVTVDLSKLANWTNRPADAIENNVFNGTQYQGVWDDTLNWFDFENSHSDEILEIPFCACGDINVVVNHLKADNNATVKLDSTLVVAQSGNDQEAMKRDDLGGNHVQGSHSVAGTGQGVNHTLRVNVHNFGSEFGVAIDGTLKFRGNLGKCE